MPKVCHGVLVSAILSEAAQLNTQFDEMCFTPEQLVLQAVAFTIGGNKQILLHPTEPNTHTQILGTLVMRIVMVFDYLQRDFEIPPTVVSYALVVDTLVLTMEINP